MTITKLTETNLESAMLLIKCVSLDLQQKNIEQWDESYPDETVIAEDIRQGHAYGLFEGDKLVGYIDLDETGVQEYDSVQWKETGGKPLMIHRLCVNPMLQNKGYGKTLLEFAVNFGRENGFGSIRLDTFIKNKIALYLFESCDYVRRGSVFFRKGEFVCFEKSLAKL